jgi:uncharacterized membrane protein
MELVPNAESGRFIINRIAVWIPKTISGSVLYPLELLLIMSAAIAVIWKIIWNTIKIYKKLRKNGKQYFKIIRVNDVFSISNTACGF